MSISRRGVLSILTSSITGIAVASTTDGATIEAATTAQNTHIDGQLLVTLGYNRPGDGGGAIYRRVPTEPSHPGRLRSKNGAWFEIAEVAVTAEMFGADGSASDNSVALQAALDYIVPRKGTLVLTAACYNISTHLSMPPNAHGFMVTSVSRSRIQQNRDNCSIFYFGNENSADWTISFIEFGWARQQLKADELSYGVRFDTRTDSNYGHRNFRMADCTFDNGWRGIGVTPTPYRKFRCPIWGAVFENLTCSERHSGSLLFFNGFGRTGQPNILVTHVYIRGDSMLEPALQFFGCDTVLIQSAEFNRTRGCGLVFSDGFLLKLTACRFEQCWLGESSQGLVRADGPTSLISVDGLTVQNSCGSGALLSAHRSATIRAENIITTRYQDCADNSLYMAETTTLGTVIVTGVGLLRDSQVELRRANDIGVNLAVGQVLRLTGDEQGMVMQPGIVAEIWTDTAIDKVIVSHSAPTQATKSLSAARTSSLTRRLTLPVTGSNRLQVQPGSSLRIEGITGQASLIIAPL